MKTTTCASCGIEFCLPDDFMAKLRQTGQGFYCPNGHSLVFRPSEIESLKAEIAELKQELTWAHEESEYYRGAVDGLRGDVAIYQHKYAGYKSQFLRLKKSLLSIPASTGIAVGSDKPALAASENPTVAEPGSPALR